MCTIIGNGKRVKTMRLALEHLEKRTMGTYVPIVRFEKVLILCQEKVQIKQNFFPYFSKLLFSAEQNVLSRIVLKKNKTKVPKTSPQNLRVLIYLARRALLD